MSCHVDEHAALTAADALTRRTGHHHDVEYRHGLLLPWHVVSGRETPTP